MRYGLVVPKRLERAKRRIAASGTPATLEHLLRHPYHACDAQKTRATSPATREPRLRHPKNTSDRRGVGTPPRLRLVYGVPSSRRGVGTPPHLRLVYASSTPRERLFYASGGAGVFVGEAPKCEFFSKGDLPQEIRGDRGR
ncbi:hypothetical protein C8R42DRAFT_643289 [Lentinula raphanica]|nr:hypothetical protein C8R42DRAFT_643289 [Lentinula raphanica]